MTTWTTISNAAVAVGAIPSSSTVTALRDNPVAMAESASGAPVVFAGWHPVDKVSVGDGKTGLLYDHAVSGNVASVITPDFVDGYEYRIIASGISHNSGTARDLQLDLFKQTSGSYASAFFAAASSAGSVWSFDWEILMPRIEAYSHLGKIVVAVDSSLSGTTVTSAYNVTVQKSLRARVRFSAGDIDSGKVWMFRRREYASSP